MREPLTGNLILPNISYQRKRFSVDCMAVIGRANSILEEYAGREIPITLTLRQLFYQFVARGWIDNRQNEYKRLGQIINNARMAGHIDWDHLQDRTRNLSRLPHWNDPGGIIASAVESYHRDLWAGQDCYVEVMIEKDALVGVIEGVCENWDVPFFRAGATRARARCGAPASATSRESSPVGGYR